MNYDLIVKKREAVRMFKSDKLDREIINKILDYGRLAPTAKNLQPQKIYVIESEDGIKKIDECTPCRYNAPVVLLVCCDKNIAWSKGNYDTCDMDGSIVATFMMLGATSLGIDTIWVKMFDENKIKELFELDDNIVPICLMPIGYRKPEYKGSINHNNRKDLKEIVKFV